MMRRHGDAVGCCCGGWPRWAASGRIAVRARSRGKAAVGPALPLPDAPHLHLRPSGGLPDLRDEPGAGEEDGGRGYRSKSYQVHGGGAGDHLPLPGEAAAHRPAHGTGAAGASDEEISRGRGDGG
jgi:hypothetical protein